jgi:6-phosphogluconolactonase (cycloisomerase 2 family)
MKNLFGRPVGFGRRQLNSYTRRFATLLGIALALLTGSMQAEFAYVANLGSNNVSAYRIGENGALTPVPGSPFPAGIRPSSIAVDLFGRFAYVANFESNDVSAYRIGFNGALMPVGGSPFPTGSDLFSGPTSVAVDPFGRFVYVTNVGSSNVSAFRINKNGALTPVAGSPFPTGNVVDSGSMSVAVDPLGRFVYVSNMDSNNISAFRIGKNGALTPINGSPFSAGRRGELPGALAVDLFGRFLYVAKEGNDTISAFRIGPNGALTDVAGSPFSAGGALEDDPRSVAVDLFGRFAFVANFEGNNVSAFRIGENGALTTVPGSPFSTGSGSGGFTASVAVDLFGRFVYVANHFVHTVSAFRIGPNGALTLIAGSPFPAGNDPISVAVSR